MFNPAALSYPDAALYLDPRFQSMLRSNSHALYSQLPYAPHLYGSPMPGVFSNLPGLHEKMKFEEEYRARIAREEEKAREMRDREIREKEIREREREQREKELREKEQREKEMREREQREKEMREKELREKELRERDQREKEMRDREKLMQQQAFMQSQRNPYSLLGMFPQMLHQMRPSMHPGYPMSPSPLMSLSIPTTHSNSMGLSPHPSQSPSSLSSSAAMNSLISPLGGLSHHGIPSHGISPDSFYHRLTNLPPPPAHLTAHYPYHNPSSPHSLIVPATSSPVIRSPSITTQSNSTAKLTNSSVSQQQSVKDKNHAKSNDITNGNTKHETRDVKVNDTVKPKEEIEVVAITSSPTIEKPKDDDECDGNPRVDGQNNKPQVCEVVPHKIEHSQSDCDGEKNFESTENSDDSKEVDMKTGEKSNNSKNDQKKENVN